jgi:UDP-N-acetylmuramoyl-L-alanyl-D-glutamate--2,6-diaminopimelate ligase
MTWGTPGVGSRPVDPTPSPVALGSVAVLGDVRGDGSALVTDVAYDSRHVREGSLFFCVPGARLDGHRYAAAAVEAGAAALVVEHALDVDVPQVVVPSVREAMGPISAAMFGRPAASMTVVGVTGTNGKTTCTYLLEAVFVAAGRVPGVIGTTGARIGGEPSPLERTTPEAPDLHRLLARMRDASVDAVAMEVSSHALAQHRVDGLRYDAACFTNLSQDHLDFHASMEEYFAAKARLFTEALARTGVANIDDPWGRRLVDQAAVPVRTYGIDTDADLRARDVRVDRDGVAFRVGDVEVRSSLRGRFNVSNALAVLATAEVVGIDLDVAARGLASVPTVPGRMETVDAGQDFLVVVDYAHTPDSILGVLRGARPLATGKLIVVFGCGGDRDRAKRPLMGRAAASEADLTIVTSDNPRSEDPLAIIDEVLAGAGQATGRVIVEPDRRAAIALALAQAGSGDVVVIAGKGHETTQEVAGTFLPFDDRAVARDVLEGSQA